MKSASCNSSVEKAMRSSVVKDKSTKELREVVQLIAEKLGIELHSYHFCTVHRLRPTKNPPPPKIFRLNCSDTRRELIFQSKQKKLNASTLGLGNFIDEFLTKEIVRLLKEATKLRDGRKIHNPPGAEKARY